MRRVRNTAPPVTMELLHFALVLFAGVATQKDPRMLDNKSVIVHLFEWKFSDVEQECKSFLGTYGYGAVQLSPVNEYLVANNNNRPWWERYQPISYKIISRSGTEEELSSMIRECNSAGVRIYVDVVLNHMSGNYPNATGTGGSSADPANKKYPGVPYSSEHFHSECSIYDYGNADQVRNCELVGLHDLNQSLVYVREKQIEFLNKLIDLGVAGFRVDAAKHMSPADLDQIYSSVNNLSTDHGFAEGLRPFFYQEVIDMGGEGVNKYEYNQLGRVTEFRYGSELSNAFRGHNAVKWLRNFGTSWSLLPDGDAVVFIDNHDTQRVSSGILTYKDSKLYKMAVAFMLSWPYGIPRVMSSFSFDDNDVGPPQDSDHNILSVTTYDDLTCGNGWVCEHRWRQIYNMVAFRNIVHGTEVTSWWDNNNKQIAFCRGDKGFIAFNDDLYDFHHNLQTCLPPGSYCDIISGNKVNNSCTGKLVTVGEDGKADIRILKDEEDGVLAIHVEAKL